MASDWWPDDEGRRFAADLGLDVDWVANQFRDYWHAQPGAAGRKVDWQATWRGWCRRQVQMDAKRAERRPQRQGRLFYLSGSIFDREDSDLDRGPIIDMAAEG